MGSLPLVYQKGSIYPIFGSLAITSAMVSTISVVNAPFVYYTFVEHKSKLAKIQ